MFVYILPIEERGVVLRRWHDERGEPLYAVRRDSDGETHLCRSFELEKLS